MRVIVENQTGALLVVDPPADAEGNAILPEGKDCRVVDLSNGEAAKLAQPGTHAVSLAGVVTVTPPAPEVLALEAQEAALKAERATARTDLRDQAQAMKERLDVIVATGATFTAVQVKDAVIDLARIQRRILRYLVANA
jgi:hypothetical protein